MKKAKKTIQNQKGQGLIEYLILVAIIGVSTMWVARTIGQNVQAGYANISNALSGNSSTKIERVKIESDQVKKRDLSDFMDGAVGKTSNNAGKPDVPQQ